MSSSRRLLGLLVPGLLLPGLLLAAPRAARAADDGEAAGTADGAGDSAEGKVKATAFALAQAGVSAASMAEVMRAIENGLKQNDRLEMKDLDTRLADFAQDVPQDQIEAARTALKDGRQALLELRVPDAVARLEEAVAGLAKVLPYIKKQELADAMAFLALAQLEGGDAKAGKAQFVELLTWRADYVYDPQKLPPTYVGSFEDAQREVEHARRGSVRITSEPAGAQAYLDGKYIGVTPCLADNVVVGKHYLTFKKEGYKKAVAPVVVAAKKETRAPVSLDRSEKYLLVEQARSKVALTLGADRVNPEADNLRQVLLLDHAVFVRVAPEGADKLAVDAWLYDLRTRQRLSHVRSVTPVDKPAGALEGLARNLYVNVSYDPELLAPADAPPPKREVRPPFFKTWWFWTAAAVVVGGAVAVGVAVAETRPPVCPEGNVCVQVAE